MVLLVVATVALVNARFDGGAQLRNHLLLILGPDDGGAGNNHVGAGLEAYISQEISQIRLPI